MLGQITPLGGLDVSRDDELILSGALNTTNVEKRVAGYMAIAIVYTSNNNKYLFGRERGLTSEDKVGIDKFIGSINEIAIFDKKLLTKIMRDVFLYKCNTVNIGLNTVSSFDDVLGINTYFGSGVKEAVDKEIKVFKTVYSAFKRVCKENS